MVQKIIGYFNVIWDDAEELQRLAQTSDPRVVIDTGGLSATATAFANLLAARIASLDEAKIAVLTAVLDGSAEHGTRSPRGSRPASASPTNGPFSSKPSSARGLPAMSPEGGGRCSSGF